jgi:hypothetical protein
VLNPAFLVKAHLGKLRQAISVVGVGLVRRHVERRLGMPRVDADRRQAFLL